MGSLGRLGTDGKLAVGSGSEILMLRGMKGIRLYVL